MPLRRMSSQFKQDECLTGKKGPSCKCDPIRPSRRATSYMASLDLIRAAVVGCDSGHADPKAVSRYVLLITVGGCSAPFSD